MSLTASRNTLRHQLARPLCAKRDMTDSDVAAVSKACATRIEGYEELGMPVPETAALQFYLLQHAMSDIRQRFGSDQPMGDVAEIVEMYHKVGVDLGQRMFVYLMMICTRESRHTKGTGAFHAKAKNKFGGVFKDSIDRMAGMNPAEAVAIFLESPPQMALGTYCEGMLWLFHNGKFTGGYAGPLWAAIAELLANFVSGKISAEIMLDTAFTLSHNGGPIFNKGMSFHGYDGTKLLLVLNVQASGQIPHMIGSLGSYPELNTHVPSQVVEMYATCRDKLGDTFGGRIDWFKVAKQELAQGYIYQLLKERQVELFGVPGWVATSEIKKLETAKVEKAEAHAHAAEVAKQKAKAQAIFDGSHFTLGIGGPVVKSKRAHVKK